MCRETETPWAGIITSVGLRHYTYLRGGDAKYSGKHTMIIPHPKFLRITIAPLSQIWHVICVSPPNLQCVIQNFLVPIPPKMTKNKYLLEKMSQSGVGSMQGSNKNCLPMKGHTQGRDAPIVLPIERTHRGGGDTCYTPTM